MNEDNETSYLATRVFENVAEYESGWSDNWKYTMARLRQHVHAHVGSNPWLPPDSLELNVMKYELFDGGPHNLSFDDVTCAFINALINRYNGKLTDTDKQLLEHYNLPLIENKS